MRLPSKNHEENDWIVIKLDITDFLFKQPYGGNLKLKSLNREIKRGKGVHY